MSHERWVAAYDVHGDHQNKDAVAALHHFCDDFKPHVRICGGDVFDFRWLRRSASDDEKLEQVTADFQNGCAFLERFKPTHFLWGNHDERIKDALDSNAGQGAMKALAQQWIDHIHDITPGCLHFPYDKRRGVFQYGDHKFLHGYSHGVGAARKHALTYGNCVIGHVHRHDVATVEGIDRRTCHIAGCLANYDMSYNRATLGTLAQEHGWVYGTKTKGGSVLVLHAKRIDGEWLIPHDIRPVSGSAEPDSQRTRGKAKAKGVQDRTGNRKGTRRK